MNLQNYVDRAFIINLPERTNRKQQAITEMEKQSVTGYEIYTGVKHENGAAGIFITLVTLIEKCYFEGLKSIAVFEDDIKAVNVVYKWFNESFHESIEFDIMYLGCNSHEVHEARTPFSLHPAPFYEKMLLKVHDVYGCHAMIISRSGMFEILKAVYTNAEYVQQTTGSVWQFAKALRFTAPIDVIIQTQVQPLGRCFASYPMLFTQRNGFSDIEKKEMDQTYLERRFIEQTEKLFKTNNKL